MQGTEITRKSAVRTSLYISTTNYFIRPVPTGSESSFFLLKLQHIVCDVRVAMPKWLSCSGLGTSRHKRILGKALTDICLGLPVRQKANDAVRYSEPSRIICTHTSNYYRKKGYRYGMVKRIHLNNAEGKTVDRVLGAGVIGYKHKYSCGWV